MKFVITDLEKYFHKIIKLLQLFIATLYNSNFAKINDYFTFQNCLSQFWLRYQVSANQFNIDNFITSIQNHINTNSNSMAYGTRRFNALFTRALQ